MKNSDLKALLKRVVELVMPDLRAYYRVPRKARVVKSYASDGRYWADVQPLRNDESEDPQEPVIPRVEIPVIWAGPDRGIVCPPAAGVHCDLTYYDGDPNCIRISNFRWHGMKSPACGVNELVIQQEPGVKIKIDASKKIISVTPSDIESTAGTDWKICAGGTATIQAPAIVLKGNMTATGIGGPSTSRVTGDFTLIGDLEVQGNIHATGSIVDDGGNTNHHSHQGG